VEKKRGANLFVVGSAIAGILLFIAVFGTIAYFNPNLNSIALNCLRMKTHVLLNPPA